MTYKRVLGVDPSLTCTGIAVAYPDGADVRVITDHVTSAGTLADTLSERRDRLRGLTDVLATHANRNTLAVIESPTYGQAGGSVLDRNALWWFYVDALLSHGADVAVVVGTTAKKWACGKGSADKAAVTAGLLRDWPTIGIASSDEADAAVLALMGAQHLGWLPTQPKYRDEAVAKVTWPEDAA